MIKFAIFGEEKMRANLLCKIYRMYGLLRFEMITTSLAVGLFIWTKTNIDNYRYDKKKQNFFVCIARVFQCGDEE